MLILLVYVAFFAGGSGKPPPPAPAQHHAATVAEHFPKRSPLNPSWKGNGRTVTLGSVSFRLRANRTTKLRIPLTAAGRKLVKGGKALDVTLTVKLTMGSTKKPTTYTQTLVLVSSKGRIPRAPTRPTKTTSRGF